MGVDTGRVRLHTDATSAATASAIGARAYTVGTDIYFGAGEHSTHTDDGRQLLAHELAHVSAGGSPTARRIRRAVRQSGPAMPDKEPTGGSSAVDPKSSGPTAPSEKLDPEAARKAEIAERAKAVVARLDAAAERCEDTIEFAAELDIIEEEFGLQHLSMVELGTPNAGVKFEINPWFWWKFPNGKIIWRMSGRATPPVTDVHWDTETLAVGNQSTTVGKHMVAHPLAPDFEAGSTSASDTDQDGIMGQLANSGVTKIAADQKYIKGHLLNDHVGGQGHSFNLFPITADANGKHLAYVEKFVKAQLRNRYVVSYEVQVQHQAPISIAGNGTAPFTIEAEFTFFWHLLDTSGQLIRAKHAGGIKSTYNQKGAEPFDISAEYASEYDKLNKGKSTPNAHNVGQWQHPSQPTGMGPMSNVTTTTPLTFPSGPSTGPQSPVADFSGVKEKTDASGIEYISVRTKDAPTNATPFTITVGPTNAPRPVTVTSVSQLGGGWTRLYF